MIHTIASLLINDTIGYEGIMGVEHVLLASILGLSDICA